MPSDKERLIKLQQSKSVYRSGSDLLSSLNGDTSLRAEVKYLTKVYLGRTLTGCSSCAMDAYIELIHLPINTINMEEKLYEIHAGAIYDPTTDNHFNNNTLTDEISERILKHNPAYIRHFRKFPLDWQERIAGNDSGNEEDTAGLLALAREILAGEKPSKKKVTDALREKGTTLKRAEELFVEANKPVAPSAPEGEGEL